MPTQTPRQALDKYDQGESPWSHDDLVDFVDEYSVERDVVANRPETGTYDDELFYATDERILYIWDDTNTAWETTINQTRTPNLSISEWAYIDVVEAGLATDGSQDAGTFIQNNAADNTLLLFPPGTYTFDTTATLDSYENFGIKAPSGGVTFTPGTLGDGDRLFSVGKSTALKNFIIDGIDTNTASAAFIDFVGDRLVFKNIEFTSERTTAQAQYHIAGFTPNPSDIVTFDNVRMPLGGAFNTTAGDSPGGVHIRGQHAGTIEFKDCEVGGFANNGIYASAAGLDTGSNGRIVVEGGTYYNSNVACLRIGGDGSVIRDADIRINTVKSGFTALRGVYVRTGSGHVLDNVRIEFSGSMSAETGIQVLSDADIATIRDCVIVDEGSNETLVVNAEDTTDTTPVSVEGLEVRGSADNSSREYAVLTERDNTTFTDCSIVQPNRSAIQGIGSLVVKDSHIDAGNVPVLASGAGSKIESAPVRVDAADVRLNDASVVSQTANAVRIIQDGWSTTDVDPSVGGNWNGHGYEGASVVDTTNGIAYHYLNGRWQSLSELLENKQVASGVVTLSSGSAVIDTGITTTPVNLDVYLDASGNGANAVDVKAAARVFWDGSATTPTYKVEILEDGTNVGNPAIGYKIVSGDY